MLCHQKQIYWTEIQINTSALDFEVNIIIKMGMQEINCENYLIEYLYGKAFFLCKVTVC